MKPLDSVHLERPSNELITKEEISSLNAQDNTLTYDSLLSYYLLFKGRTDVVGRADTLSTSVQCADTILQYLREHLSGKQRLGIYNLLPDGTTRWAVVEFEDHGDAGDLTTTDELSLEFVRHLKSVGIWAYRERSKNKNGKCWHVWIFFDKPISARKTLLTFRAFLKSVLNIVTEIFPKGYNVQTIGNFVWLPYFGGEDKNGEAWGVPKERTIFIDEENKPWLDFAEFIGQVKKTTEDDLDRLIAEYKLSLVENDISTETELVSGLDKVRECSFMRLCENNASKLQEPLWYAWITNAIRCEGGRAYIHEFSAKDLRYSKAETDKKIAHALAVTGPMTHKAISHLGFDCDCASKYKAPISRAYYRDITAEIARIKAITDIESKKVEIRSLLYYWAKLETIERDCHRAELKKGLEITGAQFKAALAIGSETAQTNRSIDYSRDLKDVLTSCQDGGMGYEDQGRVVYDWLKSRNVGFFRDREHTDYLFIDKKLMSISKNDREFESFLYHNAGVTTATKDGEVFIKVLQAITEREGKLIEANTWIHTDHATNVVYFNLNNDRDELVKISPAGVEIVENGTSAEQILLRNSTKILPLNYMALSDEEYKAALGSSKKLIVDNIPSKETDKIFSYAWRIAGMFVDYARTTPHLRFEGDSSSGKSTAMELISWPLYGADRKKMGTIASNFSDGAMNPLVLLDNLEVKNMSEGLQDFIITAVTGITKEKRKIGTDRETIEERTKCLICTTGIEPLSLNEIINRSYVVECDKEFHGTAFTDGTFLEISKHRDKIMSAEIQLISRILKKIEDGTWNSCTQMINTKYPGHAKDRANSFLALMVLIAEELLKIWDPKKNVWDIVDAWVNTQNGTAGMNTADSNPILQYLSLLRKDAIKQCMPMVTVNDKLIWNYDVEVQSATHDSLVFRGFAKDLHSTFAKLSSSRSLQYQFKTAGQLSKRIRDSKKILEAAGWKFEKLREDSHVGHEYLVSYEQPKKGGGSEVTTASLPQSSPQGIIAGYSVN